MFDPTEPSKSGQRFWLALRPDDTEPELVRARVLEALRFAEASGWVRVAQVEMLEDGARVLFEVRRNPVPFLIVATAALAGAGVAFFFETGSEIVEAVAPAPDRGGFLPSTITLLAIGGLLLGAGVLLRALRA